MELVKVLDKMFNPITMYKSDVERQEQRRKAKIKLNKERKKERGFVPSVHRLEPLK